MATWLILTLNNLRMCFETLRKLKPSKYNSSATDMTCLGTRILVLYSGLINLWSQSLHLYCCLSFLKPSLTTFRLLQYLQKGLFVRKLLYSSRLALKLSASKSGDVHSIARSQHYYKRLSIYVFVWQATESMAYTGNYLWGYRLLVM